jgi:hypothetical protein
VDRLFRFLTVIALWLIAAMIYVAFFHEGGQFKLAAPASAPASPAQVTANVAFPDKLAVVNADGAPLRIVGEVTLAKPATPQPLPKLKLTCRFTGSVTTAQPSFRMFSSEWKPDREWPLNAKLECESLELNQ